LVNLKHNFWVTPFGKGGKGKKGRMHVTQQKECNLAIREGVEAYRKERRFTKKINVRKK